jgi:hypothetical protein
MQLNVMANVDDTGPATEGQQDPAIRGGPSWSPPGSTRSEIVSTPEGAPIKASSVLADLGAILIGAVSVVVLLKSASFLPDNAAGFYQSFKSTERDPVWRVFGQIVGSFELILNLGISIASVGGIWYSWSYFNKRK